MINVNTTLRDKIRQNFAVMMNALECILDPENPITSMTVTGASGIGKTYNLLKRLDEAQARAECNYFLLNSKCTLIGLYKALWQARHRFSILVLDDVDVFDTEDKLNLLKAALDSGEKRIVSYQAASKELRDCGIPNQFTFNGKVIFITNTDLVKVSKGSSKLAAHVEAFFTRSAFCDLGIHDNESIMTHICDIMQSTNIVKKYGLSDNAGEEILKFMMDNSEKLYKPSLRLPTQICGMYLKFPKTWKSMASQLCLQHE